MFKNLPENVGVCPRADLQGLAGALLGAVPLLDLARRREADVGVGAGVHVTAAEKNTESVQVDEIVM